MLENTSQTNPAVFERAFPKGTRIGPFEIDDFIADGGWGSVFKAHDTRDGSVCALKVLHRIHALTQESVMRFEREARIAAELRHPNIVKVLYVGTYGEDCPYFAMELLPNRTLMSLIRERGPFTLSEAIDYVDQIADALALAHERGVVHRDLKAGNVAVISEGSPPAIKLLDFGIAKVLRGEDQVNLTRQGERLGTTSHMAPEQIRGDGVDHRTDIYALGVLFFRLLTGRLPFESEDALEVERMHLESPAPKLRGILPTAPAELELVLDRCLAKRKDDRFSGVTELREALQRVRSSLNGQTVAVPTRPAFGVSISVHSTSGELDEVVDYLDECEEMIVGTGLTLLNPPPNGAMGVWLFEAWPTEAELEPLHHFVALIKRQGESHPALGIKVLWKVGDAAIQTLSGDLPSLVGGSLTSLLSD